MEKQVKQSKNRKLFPAVILVIVIAAVIIAVILVHRERDSAAGDGSTDVSADAETGSTGSSGADAEENMAEEENGFTDEIAGIVQDSDGVESTFFPYESSVDELELKALYIYSGYYIEDGSEDAIDSVAVLEVTNMSAQVIEYATVTLTADGEKLNFEVALLPAGATALVMEADRKSCGETAEFSYGGSEIAAIPSLDLCEDQIAVSTDGTGAITVTNISGSDISELRLFYKNQLETGEYVGGIAYTVKLEELGAGENRTVYPSHFDPDSGVVLMVRVYEQDQTATE